MNATEDFRQVIEQAGLVPPSLLTPGKIARFPGIGFIRVGRLVRYRLQDVEAWIASRRVASTSEQAR